MTAPPPRNPALRVKLPCEDEKDFFARYADAVAEKGLKVPTANLRPVGSRVRVVLEFRNAQTVTGEGVIDAHVEGARPAMNVRVLKFERPRPGAPALTPAPMPAITPAPLPTPVPTKVGAPVGGPATASPTAKPAPTATPTPAPAPAPAPTPRPPEPAPRSSPPATAAPLFIPSAPPAEPESVLDDSLFDEAEAVPATAETRIVPAPAALDEPAPRPPADGTDELEPLFGDATRPAGSPDAEPTPSPAAAQRPTAVHRSSRRPAVVAVAAAAVLLVGVVGYGFVARRGPAPAGSAAPAPARANDRAAVAARVATADRRLADGRLAGPDGALEHLVAAKALAPDDAGVARRLALLADTLERLGSRALERGDVAEAGVHLTAALQAAPDRSSVAAKLDAVAKASRP